MKKQLVILYKDGGKIKVTNSACTDNRVFREYFGNIPVISIESAILYTYPLKTHEPLVLVENGEQITENVEEFMKN